MSTPLRFLNASVRADELVAHEKIGIGTDGQTVQLHIKADAPEIRLEDGVGQAASETATRIYADSGNTYIQSGVNFTNGSSSNIVFGSMGNTTEFVNIGAHGIETTGNLFVNNLQFTQTQGLDQILNVSNTTSNIMTLTNTSDDALNVAGGITMGSNLAVNTDDLFVDTQAGRVGIGTINPRSTLDMNVTDALIVPNGTTAERPSTAVEGMLRYNSTTGYFEAYTPIGWASIATPPSIVSFSPNPIAYANVTTEDITVSGGFFDSQSVVQLEGADGTSYDTSNFTFVDNATIRFRVGTLASGQAANRPYRVVVTNGAGLTTKSTGTLGFGAPTWSSPASGSTQTFFTVGSTTLTLSATDALGGTDVSYSLVSGSLPGGLTLSGNTISGTSTDTIGTERTVTIRASDTADTSAYTDLTFTIETVDELYAFTSHTFTDAGATGRTGPTLFQLRTAYTPSWTEEPNYLNVTSQGIQDWTVPKTGTYEIDAYGATGGYAYLEGTTSTIEYGGRGARIRGRFNLTRGQIIKILVGQMGVNNPNNSRGGGGGGGTFVYNATTTTLLIAAGGGGGGGQYSRPATADANHDSTNGNDGVDRTQSIGGSGGTNGNGGGAGYFTGGGAGWLSNGGDTTAQGGNRFSEGGTGGAAYVGDTANPGVDGGFGGGGGSYAGAGGGAGYSGGGGGGWANSGHGGGGGSYFDASAADPFTELWAVENTDGKVIITQI